jgi:hypothetical protein
MPIKSTERVVHKDGAAFKQRTLTVSERYQERAYRAHVNVPELRLQGLWLGRAGFEAGSRVVVDHVDDKLIISLLPVPERFQEAG